MVANAILPDSSRSLASCRTLLRNGVTDILNTSESFHSVSSKSRRSSIAATSLQRCHVIHDDPQEELELVLSLKRCMHFQETSKSLIRKQPVRNEVHYTSFSDL